MGKLTDIFGTSLLIRNEPNDGGNTRFRVSDLFTAIARFFIGEYDPQSDYKAGQWLIYNNQLCKCIIDAAVGENPDNAQAKFSIKLVKDPAQVTNSNDIPIAASTIRKMIDNGIIGPGNNSTVPMASDTVAGKARKASLCSYEAGLNDTDFVTP